MRQYRIVYLDEYNRPEYNLKFDMDNYDIDLYGSKNFLIVNKKSSTITNFPSSSKTFAADYNAYMKDIFVVAIPINKIIKVDIWDSGRKKKIKAENEPAESN